MLKRQLYIIFILLFTTHLNGYEVNEKEVIAALQGGIKTTQKFLKKVPSYQLYKEDKTILHYAVELRKYDVINFLISKDMELYRRGGLYYQTALQDAIFYQYFRIAKLLINSGSPLDIQNIDGDTALHIAARNGYLNMVQLLLAHGASKNIYNENDQTPYDTVSNFMMDNSKKIKAILKPDKKLELKKEHSIIKQHSTIKRSSEMNRGQATFTLDQMYFDDQVGVSIDTPIQSKGFQRTIIKNTDMKNTNIGLKINSN